MNQAEPSDATEADGDGSGDVAPGGGSGWAETPTGRYVAFMSRWGGWALWVGAVVMVLGIVVPWRPVFDSSVELDSSWRYVLSWAFVKGLAFGRDVVFTYGPWGFAASDHYYPGTFRAMLGARLLVALAMAGGWWELCRRLRFPAVVGGPVVVLLCAVAWMTEPGDPFFYCLPVLAVMLYLTGETARDGTKAGVGSTPKWAGRLREVRVDWALLFVSAALGLAGLMKFTTLLHATAVLGLCAGVDVVRRRWPGAALVFGGSVGVFWLMAGQPVGTFPAFLVNTFEVARGFDEGMGGPSGDWMMYPLFAVGAVMVVGVGVWGVTRLGRAREGGKSWAGLVGPAVLGVTLVMTVLLIFKAGFVRHDGGHEAISTRTLFCLGLMMLPVVWARVGGGVWGRWGLRGLSVAAIGVAWVCVHFTYVRLFPAGESAWGALTEKVTTVGERVAFSRELLSDRSLTMRRFEEAKKAALKDNPLPVVSGSVDLYSVNQAILLLGDYEYKPRPVIQSYSAYTGRLQELNAAHLRGTGGGTGGAPETVMASAFGVDGRLPGLDDALSWPELLARYDPADYRLDGTGRRGPVLVLRRSASPRAWRLEPLQKQTVRFGEAVTVPGAEPGPVWMTVKLKKTAVGKVLGTLVKSPVVMAGLEIAGQAGGGASVRLIPSVLERGVMISPVVPDMGGWAEMYRSRAERRVPGRGDVNRITFGLQPGESPRVWYGEEIEVEFSRLVYATRTSAELTAGGAGGASGGGFPIGLIDVAEGEIRDRAGKVPVVFATVPAASAGGASAGQSGGAGVRVLLAPGDRTFRLRVPPRAPGVGGGSGVVSRSAVVTFGVRAESASRNRVIFRVLGLVPQAGSAQPGVANLFEQLLDPDDTKGPQTAAINLPAGVTEILLQTVTSDQENAPESYWGEVGWGGGK